MLYYECKEQGVFAWPKRQGDHVVLTRAQLNGLLAGLILEQCPKVAPMKGQRVA